MTETPAAPLSNNALDVPDERVVTPAYDRSRLRPAVVHFGVGGFHRAHQAVYFDQLAELGFTGWGVIGVGVRRREMGRVLRAQDNLFTVVQRGGGDSSARVVASMVEYLLLAEQPGAVLARLVDPGIRLVTLTVTAEGYVVPGDPVRARVSVFGLIVEALQARRGAGLAPFTVLSCDNLPDSAGAARAAVLGLAAGYGSGLVEWVERRVAFPASMVDRITPATSPEDREGVVRDFGVGDGWPVITEPFRQWVIEDAFCNDRPPLDRVGARFVPDVAPYKLIKSRLLNGAHCALGYVGVLAGYRGTDEAMADPVVAGYVEALMREEIAPLLPGGVPEMDLGRYCGSLLERFANPAIADQLSRLCRRGSTKMPDYLLPSLHEARARGGAHGRLLFAVAAWMRCLRGVGLDGAPIEVQDARAQELREAAGRGGADPRVLLELTDIFGDLGRDAGCVAELRGMLAVLDEQGLPAAIASLTTEKSC